MKTTEILSHFLRMYVLWVNDNIGDGDGTRLIMSIWEDDPTMAAHLLSKWNGYRRRAAEEIGTEDDTRSDVQLVALQNFLVSLDPRNTEIFTKYVAEHSRTT